MPAPKLKPLFPYPGGKTRLLPSLLSVLPPHQVYVEPFVGGGALFFAKTPAAKSVIADADPRITFFYKNFSCAAVKKCLPLNACKAAATGIEKMRKGNPGICDTLAARRFSVVAAAHGVKKKECVGRSVVPMHLRNGLCKDYEKLLGKTRIMTADFRKVFARNDSPTTLTYMDPPYVHTTSEYVNPRVDPKEVCDLAREARGKVLISFNDHPEVRRACRGLSIRSVIVKQPMKAVQKHATKSRELLIANYPLPPVL